ncbi:hypothetical protein RI367_004348 [Sorochytrium milnesiophthora]
MFADYAARQEELVLLELGLDGRIEMVEQAGYKCALIGIDTEHPYLQIGDTLLRGEMADALGSDLVFAGDANKLVTTPQTSVAQHAQPHLELVSNAPRRIRFRKVDAEPRQPAGAVPTTVPAFEAVRRMPLEEALRYTIDDQEYMNREPDDVRFAEAPLAETMEISSDDGDNDSDDGDDNNSSNVNSRNNNNASDKDVAS